MRALLLLALLAACAPVRGDDDDATEVCDPATDDGSLEVCAWWWTVGEEPQDGTITVTPSSDPQGEIEGVVRAETGGCTTFELAPGSYDLTGTDNQWCGDWAYGVEVVGCEVTRVDLRFANGCVDGR